MLCSILISNYNKSKYIRRCLDSLTNQSYKNIEIIFFDNNSTDNSLQIASNFKNIKIFKKKRIFNYPALNQIDIINEAFLKSKGKFIFLLDSDDFFDTNKINSLVSYHKEKNYDFICDIPNIFFNKYKIENFKIKTHFNFLRSWPTIFPTSSLSFSKKFFLNFQKYLFPNDYNKLEIDFRLNIIAYIEKQKNIYSDEKITFYNQTTDGIMASYKKFDRNWWIKRLQAHHYLQKVLNEKKIKYNNKMDFFITRIINKFI